MTKVTGCKDSYRSSCRLRPRECSHLCFNHNQNKIPVVFVLVVIAGFSSIFTVLCLHSYSNPKQDSFPAVTKEHFIIPTAVINEQSFSIIFQVGPSLSDE